MYFSSALKLGFLGPKSLSEKSAYGQTCSPYGPLLADPNKLLNHPAGFRYVAISRTGEMMDDGFSVPGAHDAMCALPAPMAKSLSSEISKYAKGHRSSSASPNSPPSPRYSRAPRTPAKGRLDSIVSQP